MPKISDLPAGTAPTGAELIPVVQGGVTVRMTLDALTRLATLQVVTTASDAVDTDTTLLAVERSAPTATALALPPGVDGRRLSIVDWSLSVTDHAMTLTPSGAETIMRAPSWTVYSNSAQLGSVTLHFSAILGGWFIAP